MAGNVRSLRTDEFWYLWSGTVDGFVKQQVNYWAKRHSFRTQLFQLSFAMSLAYCCSIFSSLHSVEVCFLIFVIDQKWIEATGIEVTGRLLLVQVCLYDSSRAFELPPRGSLVA